MACLLWAFLFFLDGDMHGKPGPGMNYAMALGCAVSGYAVAAWLGTDRCLVGDYANFAGLKVETKP
jgi:hypothetical protein